MVVVGSCSAAISAACHAAIDSDSVWQHQCENEQETNFLLPSAFQEGIERYEMRSLASNQTTLVYWREQIAQSRLMWGEAVATSQISFSVQGVLGRSIGHLTFGTQYSGVRPVEDGCWYAG
jgi:hypothetical protein